MKILALDPATNTGYAHTNGQIGTWKLGSEQFRLLDLRRNLLQAIQTWGCDMIAFEDASYGAGGRKGEGGVQWKTVVFHNELRGVIKLVAAELKIEWKAFHPSTVKLFATGSGIAKKAQMIAAAFRHYGLKLSQDEADAKFILELAMKPTCWPEPKKPKAKRRIATKKIKGLFDA